MSSVNQQRLQLYIDAEARILKGQSVWIGSRRLELPNLADVRAEIARLQTLVARENAHASGSGAFAVADFGGRT